MGNYTEAQLRAKRKWLEKNREQLNVSVPKGTTDRIHEAMKVTGDSKNVFVYKAVNEKIARAYKEVNLECLSDEELEKVAGGASDSEDPLKNH